MDERLHVVADMVPEVDVVVDVGSDHGQLLKHLIATNKIVQGIAIENKRVPYENSRGTLAGLAVDVRLGDGLEAMPNAEAACLTICGMGADSMVKILRTYPNRIPEHVVLQPNKDVFRVRNWGYENGYHLQDERLVVGYWVYPVLRFRKCEAGIKDPLYDGHDLRLAFEFGPLLLKRRDPILLRELRQNFEYLKCIPKLCSSSRERLDCIEAALTLLG